MCCYLKENSRLRTGKINRNYETEYMWKQKSVNWIKEENKRMQVAQRKTNRIHEGKQGCLKNNADPEKELSWKS